MKARQLDNKWDPTNSRIEQVAADLVPDPTMDSGTLSVGLSRPAGAVKPDPVGASASGSGSAASGATAASSASTVGVRLVLAGQNKIQVIKAVRELTQLGLKEAKDFVEAAPQLLPGRFTSAEAARAVHLFAQAGASAEITGG